ncbi:hypothetical protein L1887_20242 [Cichorium endivia]|nr:hypothetical protein L1887_20242 [Cichorium endivia]
MGRVTRWLKGLFAIKKPKDSGDRKDNNRAGLKHLKVRTICSKKKCQGRVAEVETQVSQLEDALRTVKDQLIVSETWKKQAKIDAEESRKELLAINLRLEESQQKLLQMKGSTEAIKKSKDEVVTVTERLEAVKMSNSEMEEELRRLKVKMSQWRKAAEAATDMLCDENSGVHYLGNCSLRFG